MKLGKFTINSNVIKENPDLARHILSDMIVVRAEQMFVANEIEYIAISDLFRDVPRYEITPSYKIEVDENAVVRAVEK